VLSPSARSQRSSEADLAPLDRRLKLVARLASARQRDKLGLFVCEGEDLVEAARAEGIEPVELLVAGDNVDATQLASVSALGHPPRVIAVFRRDDLPRRVRRGGPGLALWHVADPGNVGTLIRSADALGGSFVALSAGCADPTGPKAVRASMGSLFRVPLISFDDAPRPWIALAPRGGDDVHPLQDGSFVLGAERNGLPDGVLARCDGRATIPLAAGAESLNVAMAGTIALYESSRRRATQIESSPPEYGLRSNQP
jgi:TrmH family RNA methyltransferase